MRQVALWVVIEERLEANYLYEVRKGADKRKLGKVFINIESPSLPRLDEGDQMTDLDLWKMWFGKVDIQRLLTR